ncbi:MAG: hypothetical protein EXQ87_08950 [Alphaproteobacteria bacterium]|nr:hypothetical protein [Alphaproteobacteria bacterium]
MRQRRFGKFIVFLTLLVVGTAGGAGAADKKCLFVSSYEPTYDHSQAIEQGLRSVVDGKCDIRQFNMDAKRRTAAADRVEQGLAAKAIIEAWQPDVVIVADDEATKYLLESHYREHDLPFVFCGVNWSGEAYGLPYSNATGMIEVAPILPALQKAKEVVPGLGRALYLGAASFTEEGNVERFERAGAHAGVAIDGRLVTTTDAWIEAYERGQDYDLVIIGSSEGIKDWDGGRALEAVQRRTRKLSLTNHPWMMPWSILGVTKISEEQGEWAGKVALRILAGNKPSQIPVVPNKERDFWINEGIRAAGNVALPRTLMQSAKRVTSLGTR